MNFLFNTNLVSKGLDNEQAEIEISRLLEKLKVDYTISNKGIKATITKKQFNSGFFEFLAKTLNCVVFYDQI